MSSPAPEDSSARSLATIFLDSANRWPDRPAVAFADGSISYAELRDRALSIAASLEGAPEGAPSLVAVLARRSPTAFAAILGSLIRGAAYLPLDPSRASDRNRAILERTGCRTLVADEEGGAALSGLVGVGAPRMRILMPDLGSSQARSARGQSGTNDEVLGCDDLEKPSSATARAIDPRSMAYLLFTSGSTGVPKGVMVSHASAVHLVDMAAARYAVSPEDRFSHNFALTFDLSIFDMFVAWSRGACVCCPTDRELLRPDRYLERESLSIWFSVPSVAVMMHRLKLLKKGAFDGLRLSLFCGEALPETLAAAWAASAPGAPLENLYGPTEATVFCTGYRWKPELAGRESERGVVPIGRALPGVETCVVDEALSPVAAGEVGELLVGGPQVALGYWEAPDLTARAFVELPDRRGRFYRTGDQVRHGGEGPLQFLGRKDHQVKIRGYRVELGEIEAALRHAAGVEQAVVLPLRVTDVGIEHVAGLVAASQIESSRVRKEMARLLPPYMVPREILAVPVFPENDNGKVDRGALTEILKQRMDEERRRR